jgi:hypothetical protein
MVAVPYVRPVLRQDRKSFFLIKVQIFVKILPVILQTALLMIACLATALPAKVVYSWIASTMFAKQRPLA